MAEALAVSARNAAEVRAGRCWECGSALVALPTLLERWQECAACSRRFLILSERLIIERMRIPAEIVGRALEGIAGSISADELVAWDGTAIVGGALPEDAWFEMAWRPPLAVADA